MSRSEDGTVLVRITITHTDAELAAVAARAWEVENVLEDAIIADPTLGGLVDEARIRRLKGSEAIPDERTRQYGIEASVTYSGTITAL